MNVHVYAPFTCIFITLACLCVCVCVCVCDSQGLLSPLLTLLLYHTAYVRLGRSSSSANLGGGRGSSGGSSGVGGDWGGTEGVGKRVATILLSLYSLASSQADWLEVCLAYTNVMHALSTLAGAVVHQLQTEIASLPDPSDPQQVLAIYTTMYILYYLLHRAGYQGIRPARIGGVLHACMGWVYRSGQPVLEGYCMHAWAGYIMPAWGRLLGYQAIVIFPLVCRWKNIYVPRVNYSVWSTPSLWSTTSSAHSFSMATTKTCELFAWSPSPQSAD